MFDEETIKREIAKINQLRASYDALTIIDPNRSDTIEAYHKWYEESCVVFSHYFNSQTEEYVNFTSVDNDANGYGLKNNYQRIRKDFCVLLDKMERGDFNNGNKVAFEQLPLQKEGKKKIFISHASKDSELINKFVDDIILLGMGLDSDIIAYTSREETGVIPGESIPQFIQDNIACADIVLLMISDNFKNSEVCLNEMGAAWALNKHIVQILLPNTSFEKLGWLCSLKRAIKIDSNDSLDDLCVLFSDKLDFGVKLTVWNRNKAAFLSYVTSLP